MPLLLQAAAVAPEHSFPCKERRITPEPSLCWVCRPGELLGLFQEQGWPRGRWHPLGPCSHAQYQERRLLDVLCAPAPERHQSRSQEHKAGTAAIWDGLHPVDAFYDSCQRSLLLRVATSPCRALSPRSHSPAIRRNR